MTLTNLIHWSIWHEIWKLHRKSNSKRTISERNAHEKFQFWTPLHLNVEVIYPRTIMWNFRTSLVDVSFALQDKSQITVGLQNAISKVITNQKQEYRTDLHQKTQKEMKRMGVIMFKQKRQWNPFCSTSFTLQHSSNVFQKVPLAIL